MNVVRPHGVVFMARNSPTPVAVKARASAAAGAGSTVVQYMMGGPVLGAVQVIPIYWGAFWASGAGFTCSIQLDGFFDFILTSSLMDLLAEYSTPTTAIGQGSRPTSVTISDSEPDTGGSLEITDPGIQTALSAWIAAGTVPAPTSNTLYFIYLPPGITCVEPSKGVKSCRQPSGICGYHGHIGTSVFYGVIPFLPCSGCDFGGTPPLDSLTKVSAHELAEGITNPTFTSWWDPSSGDEIADICNTDARRLGGFLVQTVWSNKQNACALAPSGL